MAKKVSYKVEIGTLVEIEKKLNELAEHGWRVVTSSQTAVNTLAVILEKKEAQ